MNNNDINPQEMPGLLPFFKSVDWHEWTCINFLRFVRSGRIISPKEKSLLHQAYKQNLLRIQPIVPEEFYKALDLSLVNIHFLAVFLYTF
jgi:hypothetical protein